MFKFTSIPVLKHMQIVKTNKIRNLCQRTNENCVQQGRFKK